MIATVTFNPAIDLTTRVDGLPAGRVTRTDTQRFDAAGKGVNVTQYLDALGTASVATGPVGGFTGRYVREALEADGIRHDLVEIDGTTRVNITVAAPGAEYKINHSGPRMDPGIVDRIAERLEAHEPGTVVVSGSLPPGLDGTAIDRIAAGDWATVVDVGGTLLAGLTGGYRLCKPNREELGDATGMPTGTRDEVVAAAAALRETGYAAVLVSLGEEGAILVDGEEPLYAAAPEVAVADTVGAGDAVLAGFLAARDRGADRAETLRTGIALASRVVATSGTQVPDMDGFADDVEAVTVTEP